MAFNVYTEQDKTMQMVFGKEILELPELNSQLHVHVYMYMYNGRLFNSRATKALHVLCACVCVYVCGGGGGGGHG